MKVLIDDNIPFLEGVLEPYGEIRYKPGAAISSKDLKDVQALLVRTRTRCNALLLKTGDVGFIASATSGIDHIDTDYCDQNSISWHHAPGCNADSVVQYVAAALSFWSIRTRQTLRGKCIGIVGVGHVGSRLVKFCETMGMRVLQNDPPRVRREGASGFVDLKTLLNESHIITLHTPLIRDGADGTFHLIHEERFRKMARCALLINTSRGEVVDNMALKKALTNGLIHNAVLDVWENEPDIDLNLMRHLLLATPHIAGYAADGKARGSAMCVQALAAHFQIPELSQWFPQVPPPPRGTDLTVSHTDQDAESILKQTLLKTYAILTDDQALRKAPEKFEWLRGNYPIRREFSAFQLQLNPANSKMADPFGKLGFAVFTRG